MVVAMTTVAGVNSNGIALSIDPFPAAAASAAALVGGLQMLMGSIASTLLSSLPLPPAVEMGLVMTVAASVSLALSGVAMRRRVYV